MISSSPERRAPRRRPLSDLRCAHTDHCLEGSSSTSSSSHSSKKQKGAAQNAGQRESFTGHMFDRQQFVVEATISTLSSKPGSNACQKRFLAIAKEIEKGAVGGEEDNVVGDRAVQALRGAGGFHTRSRASLKFNRRTLSAGSDIWKCSRRL